LLLVVLVAPALRLLVEGGAGVAGSFLEAGLVDEIQLIRSSKTLGTKGVDAKLVGLKRDFELKPQKTRTLGEDLLEIYTREH
jgi:diaminohydroxyphosphoribosylaminopyrimidine deaminase/5-amino-6-(5-phosphoribosylamino)uracil reductase